MWLKMKNVNIMGFRQFLGENWGAVGGGGGGTKSNKYGELSKKGGLDNLQEAWQKIGRRVSVYKNTNRGLVGFGYQ